MAIQPLRYYKFSENVLVIGGRQIVEFGDDGGIEYEFNSDLVEAAVTADGVPVFSEILDPLCVATITVNQTGEGYKYLSALTQAQKAARAGSITRLNYLHRNLIQGDIFASQWCIFASRPTPGFGKTASTVEFRMFLPYVGDSVIYGSRI
jgi:hypothetical protein